MTADLNAYLNELRRAINAQDPSLAEDAVWDARTHLERELKRLAWEAPELNTAQALERILASLGSPEAAAARYLERDDLASRTSGAPRTAAYDRQAPDTPPRPWPTFFGILSDVKAYTSLLYLALAMLTGPIYWTWVWTGLSVSFSLLFIFVGFPLLALALGSFRALGAGEVKLAETLLDVPMPPTPRILPPHGTFWARLKALFCDGHTWRCTAYLLSHLPMTLMAFTLVITLLATSLGLTLLPVAHWYMLSHGGAFVLDFGPLQRETLSAPMALLLSAVGLLGLVGTLHLVLGLGRLQGRWARWLLVG